VEELAVIPVGSGGWLVARKCLATSATTNNKGNTTAQWQLREVGLACGHEGVGGLSWWWWMVLLVAGGASSGGGEQQQATGYHGGKGRKRGEET